MNLMDEKVQQYKRNAAGLSEFLPEVADTYQQFTGECFSEGELDSRTKQLIALGIALFANNEICTYYHVQEARAKGATDQQIMEAAAVASGAASGHVLSQGVMRVQSALLNKTQQLGEDPSDDGMGINGGQKVSPSY